MQTTSTSLDSRIKSAKILLVGCGGVGCELLKNLVLVRFSSIDVIDFDTIEVSNLNRQFLFRRCHIGRPKAEIAVESVGRLNPEAKLHCFNRSVQEREFDVNFFKQYTVVLNALDNQAARNHVNRLCLTADVPLIESGTSGYFGQVEVIRKNHTECYECKPKPPQRTYPSCTIRNTPSEPVHCIIWAKYLFNQLFGEPDIDEEVSPDKAAVSKENGSENGVSDKHNGFEKDGSAADPVVLTKLPLKVWARKNNYRPDMIFNKIFDGDICYLLLMSDLWKNRRPPVALHWDGIPVENGGPHTVESVVDKEERVWSLSACRSVFEKSLNSLRTCLSSMGDSGDAVLTFDKDDEDCMDFVAACANLRAHCFHIPLQTRFTIKSIAGNIVPAIATTNAVIAGAVVIEALKIVSGHTDRCSNVSVGVNVDRFSVKALENRVLKGHLNMVAPDVERDDNSGTIVISSDPEESEGVSNKTLAELSVFDGDSLKCDDFMQNFKFRLIIHHNPKLAAEQFEVLQTGSSSIHGESQKNSEETKEQIAKLTRSPTATFGKKRPHPASNVIELSPMKTMKIDTDVEVL